MSFHQKLESVQYNVWLVITGAIRGTSEEKLYQELGLESLQLRCWYRKLVMLYKIHKNKSPQYLMLQEMLITFPVLKSDTTSSKALSFTSTIIEWNNLDLTLWNSKSFVVSENSILKFIRLSPSHVFNCDNCVRLITRLRVGMSNLGEHKFKHNFQDCGNPICSCGLDIESTSYFLLHHLMMNDTPS